MCWGTRHLTPWEAKTNPDPDPRRLSSGSAEGLKVQTERTRSMLLFANVSARHYGNYTCRAANRLGASSASMRLLRASAPGGGVGQGCGGGARVGPSHHWVGQGGRDIGIGPPRI